MTGNSGNRAVQSASPGCLQGHTSGEEYASHSHKRTCSLPAPLSPLPPRPPELGRQSGVEPNRLGRAPLTPTLTFEAILRPPRKYSVRPNAWEPLAGPRCCHYPATKRNGPSRLHRIRLTRRRVALPRSHVAYTHFGVYPAKQIRDPIAARPLRAEPDIKPPLSCSVTAGSEPRFGGRSSPVVDRGVAGARPGAVSCGTSSLGRMPIVPWARGLSWGRQRDGRSQLGSPPCDEQAVGWGIWLRKGPQLRP